MDIDKYNTLMSYDKEKLIDIIMAYESINNVKDVIIQETPKENEIEK